MNILIAASEVFPFCKTGGLADVAGALAQVLSRTKGNKVTVFLPRYRTISGGAFALKSVPGTFLVPVGDHYETASLSHVQWGNASVYFVDNPKYFDRTDLYRTRFGDFHDNDERFIFFSRAVLEGAKFIGFKPDVIHCHDWQTALIPAYLKTLYAIDAFFAATGSVMTVHNIAYQGFFGKDTLFKAGFGWMDFTSERLEFYDGVNFLKAGLVYGDVISTVSPTYAAEVQSSSEAGRGLDGILRARSSSFYGILNGIDTELWDPEGDSFIPVGYYEKSFTAGKAAAKKQLQELLGLEVNPSIPMAGVVSRLDYQKGLDVVADIAPRFLDRMQLVVLGMGDHNLQDWFGHISATVPTRAAYRGTMDEALAHKIYAASDMLLMPSRFEPCGLSQMIAMRYGALPVAVKTGGIADTVIDTEGKNTPNGFLAKYCEGGEVAWALENALKAFADRKRWIGMVRNAMSGDFSWDKSAELYMELYKKVYAAKHRG